MRFQKRNGKNNSNQAKQLACEAGISEVMAALLVDRMVTTKEEVREFLNPNEEMLLNPFSFRAMEEVCALIMEFIDGGIPIAVYSDYDCDGVCGAAIMTKCLKKLGGEVRTYIPDRFTEGYGTNEQAFRMLVEEVGLIITVDCGIRSVRDIQIAREFDVEVVVLDHHEPEELPDTPYILNPKVEGETYQNKNLCGAGVCFKLACALLGEDAMEYIDLAGIATIGDVVSLTGENRAIAALGIKKLKENGNPAIRALLECAGVDDKKIGSYEISFMLAPRLNVAGRIEHAYSAFDLLMEEDTLKQKELACHLNELNEKRQTIQKSVTDLSFEQIEKTLMLTKDRVLMVAVDGANKGVVGLAASKISERFHRPAVVFAKEGDMLTGSARSVFGVNIFELLQKQESHYLRFGGHEQAAGLSMKEAEFAAVKELVNQAALEMDDELFVKKVIYDLELEIEEADETLVEGLSLLEPFGEGNPAPVFLIKNAMVSGVKKMGKRSEHTKASIKGLSCIRFFGELKEGGVYDLLGSLSINEFNGNRTVQLIIKEAVLVSDSESSLSAYHVKSFLNEIRSMDEVLQQKEEYCLFREREPFLKKLSSCIEASPLGTAVIANTSPGIEALKEAKLPLPISDKVPNDTAENIAVLSDEKKEGLLHYENIFCFGGFALAKGIKNACVLLDKPLWKRYREEMASYFVRKEKLPLFLSAYQTCTGAYSRLTELMEAAGRAIPGATQKQLWFALNVFFEQKLIVLKKSDKIELLYRNTAPEESRIYEQFAKYIGR